MELALLKDALPWRRKLLYWVFKGIGMLVEFKDAQSQFGGSQFQYVGQAFGDNFDRRTDPQDNPDQQSFAFKPDVTSEAPLLDDTAWRLVSSLSQQSQLMVEMAMIVLLLIAIGLLVKILRILTRSGAQVLRRSANGLRDSVEFFSEKD